MEADGRHVERVIIEITIGSSFTGLSDSAALGHQLFYFSFVTLTTLGYGDMTPAVPTTQALAYLEAIAGQMYIAILVAGLIGALVARRQT